MPQKQKSPGAGGTARGAGNVVADSCSNHSKNTARSIAARGAANTINKLHRCGGRWGQTREQYAVTDGRDTAGLVEFIGNGWCAINMSGRDLALFKTMAKAMGALPCEGDAA